MMILLNSTYEEAKMKAIKYISSRKKTPEEVKRYLILKQYSEDVAESVVEHLIEIRYIDTHDYIESYIHDILKLKHWSIKRIELDLKQREIREDLEQYIERYNLWQYEKDSANYYVAKKSRLYNKQQMEAFLYKNGFKRESYAEILEEYYNR